MSEPIIFDANFPPALVADDAVGVPRVGCFSPLNPSVFSVLYAGLYTCRGKDFQQDMPDSGRHYEVVYWNLDVPIWTKEDNEIEIMERGNIVAVNLSPDRVKDF